MIRVAPDGTKQGDPIPGSKLLRSFCSDPKCGEPIRVEPDRINKENYCNVCSGWVPAPHSGLTERQRLALSKTQG